MKRIAVIAALLATACGADAELQGSSGTAATITLQSSIEAATRKLTVRIIGPRDKSNVIVTCTSLLSGNPIDARYDTLKTAELDYPPSDPANLMISDVKKKDGVVVYVDARNAQNQVIGEGCEAGVDVEGGKTATVNIVIYPAS